MFWQHLKSVLQVLGVLHLEPRADASKSRFHFNEKKRGVPKNQPSKGLETEILG